MTITYESGDIPGGNPTTSFTLAPAAAAVGDVVCVDFTHNGTGNGTVTDNSGDGVAWTRKGGGTFGGTKSVHTYWKRIVSNAAWQAGTVTITVGSLTNSGSGANNRYRGVIATGDPFRAHVLEVNASGDVSHASVTTQAGDWVVLVVANSPDLAVTPTAPLVLRQEKLSTGGTDCSTMVAGFEDTGGGGSGALAWTQTASASGSIGYSLIPEPVLTGFTVDPADLALSAAEVTMGGTGAAAVTVDPAILLLDGPDVVFAGSGAVAVTVDPADLALSAADVAFAASGAAPLAVDPATLILSAVDIALIAATFDQAGFRGRNDDGSQTTATWKAAENTDWTQVVNQVFRLRFVIDETAGVSSPQLFGQLQRNLNGGGWVNVHGTSTVAQSAASAFVPDLTVCTRQLTSGVGTFHTGEFESGNGIAHLGGANPYPAGDFVESEWCLKLLAADVVDGDTIQFRLIRNTGLAFNTYSQIPTVTVSEGGGVTVDPATLVLTAAEVTLAGTGAAAAAVDSATVALGAVDIALAGSAAAPLPVDPATLILAGVDVGFAAAGGPQSWTLDPADLALAAVDIAFAPSGAATLPVDPATLALSAVDVAFAPSGAAPLPVDPATLVLGAVDVVFAAIGTAPLPVDPAALVLSAADIGFAPTGAATLPVDPVTLALSATDVILAGVGVGAWTVDPGVLVLSAADVGLAVAGFLAVDPATLVVSALDVAFGGVGAVPFTVDPAVLVLAAADVGFAATGVAGLPVDPATLLLSALDIAAGGAGVAAMTVDPATLVLTALDIVIVVGTVSLGEVGGLLLTSVPDYLSLRSEPGDLRLRVVEG